MYQKLIRRVLGATLLLLTTSANANLIVNGGFEDFGAGERTAFANTNNANMIGWTSNGDFFEVWDTFGRSSFEGFQHLELNSNGTGPWSIWQSFSATADEAYVLSFAAAKRTSGAESFVVSMFSDAGEAFSQLIQLPSQDWTEYSFIFKANANLMTLRFTSVSPEGTVGNFIDGVSVSVSEPSMIALLGLALFGLGARRKLIK